MPEKVVTLDELDIPGTVPLPERNDWRIGLVGFGGIATAHAKAYAAAGWRIVAAADPDPAARERARDEFGVERVYEDYLKLIADDEVEVVSLLTQPTLREPVVAAAVKAGKPILTEKPFGTDIAECERMVESSEKAAVLLAVSQNYRWAGANFVAYHIIRKGLIGRPYFASIEIQGTQDVSLAEHAFYSRCDDFLTIQWNNHLADLLRYWTGRDARRVLACTRRMKGQNFVSDNLLVSIADFGDGLTGHIVHSELLRSPLKTSTCRVDGDGGSVVFELSGRDLKLHSKMLGDDVLVLDRESVELASSFSGPMGDLLISIEKAREPLVSGRKNLATIRHIMAEAESVRQGGRWVEL